MMSCALALLLLLPIPGTPSQAPANLRFELGRLTHWEGQGFYITPASGHGPSLACGVCSSDGGNKERTALLHRTFVIPPGTGAIRFRAAAIRPRGVSADGNLDVVCEASGRRFLPRCPLADLKHGKPLEYQWNVSAFVGQNVRIALMDRDLRPGCYLLCSGFEFVSQQEPVELQQFANEMVELAEKHDLASMVRLASRHFLAIGNTDDEYLENRLYNCETLYNSFVEHFRERGFTVHPPTTRLMVSIFESQAGFEAAMRQKMSVTVTGLYDRRSNRLLVYDYGHNRAYLAGKARGEEMLKRVPMTMARQQVVSDFTRQARNIRNDANIGTMMHEASHQLAFNSGLLNREGDAPLWLVEGMACYCESTRNGLWLGIGEPNQQRLATLARARDTNTPLLSVRDMVRSDDWLHASNSTVQQALLGYAQSWALFRMLMEERPKALNRYLLLIQDRRTPDHRLTDFAQIFGDPEGVEKRLQQYVKERLRQDCRPPK